MASTGFLKGTLVYTRDVFWQTLILLVKNFLLYLRRWPSTILQIFAPFFVFVVLILLALLVQSRANTYYDTFPTTLSNTEFRNCKPFAAKHCYNLAYTTNNYPVAQQVMDHIVDRYLLDENEVISFPYENDMIDYIYNNPNMTLTALSFNQTALPAGRNLLLYTIHFNTTGDVVAQVAQVQHIVDNAIAYVTSNLTTGSFIAPDSIKVDIKGFPRPPQRANGVVTIFQTTGPLFFSLSAMIILVVSMHSLVMEKEDNLRFGMKMMGLRDAAYWASWMTTFILIALLSALVTVVSGLIFNIFVFTSSHFFVVFFLFFVYKLNLICVAVLLSTFFRQGRASLIFGFILIALSFILNSLVSNALVIYQLYSESIPLILPILFCIYPPFNFAKMFADISLTNVPVFDSKTREWVAGTFYEWNNLYITQEHYGVKAPPSADSLYIMLGSAAFCFLLGIYLDNILPTGGNGSAKNPFFFLFPSYWGCFCGQKKIGNNNHPLSEEELAKLDKDIKDEYAYARNADKKAAIRILQLKKSFWTLRKKIEAIRGLDLMVEEGQCLALLGHNGAGKTTTISVIIGLISPSSGDVHVFDKSVKYHIDEIRKSLGVCAQYDILWPDLTAREHLFLFSMFKGVPLSKVKHEIETRLAGVDLTREGNKTAQTYSGGMKRRLSVAISCIGDPKLILLDEPTTGMDPASRRKVWKLINDMKKNRVIVLTTHAMEEADALADRIAIMAGGKLRAVGDNLHLKQKYSAGYNLTMIANPGKEKLLQQFVKTNLTATQVTSNAGSFVYNVKPEYLTQLTKFIELVELEDKQTGTVKDWGISHTTLEEVYFKVTQEADYALSQKKSEEEAADDPFPEQQELVEQPMQPNVIVQAEQEQQQFESTSPVIDYKAEFPKNSEDFQPLSDDTTSMPPTPAVPTQQEGENSTSREDASI